MCFSYIASFSSSAILFSLGVGGLLYNYRINNGNDAKHWMGFLFTPLLFGTQQLCEGLVWLHIDSSDTPQIEGYIFTFFANCFWPIWVPFICFLLELRGFSSSSVNRNQNVFTNRWIVFRLIILSLLFVLGSLLFGFMLSGLVIESLSVEKSNSQHIDYNVATLPINNNNNNDDASLKYLVIVPYLICTTLPFCLVHSTRYCWTMTMLVGVSAILSYIFYKLDFASTWCFFAAILSTVTILIRVLDARSSSTLEGNEVGKGREVEYVEIIITEGGRKDVELGM